MNQFKPKEQSFTKYLFFTGKGGVGKTSTACAVAVDLAEQGKKVLLISTDPASNLQDVFATELNSTGKQIAGISNLFVAKDLEIHISKGTQITKDTADSYRKNIKSIGEPIIREKLEQMLVQCSEVDKQSRICQLEKELSDLRSRNDSHQR